MVQNGKGKTTTAACRKNGLEAGSGEKAGAFDMHRSVDVRIYCLFSSGSGGSRFHPCFSRNLHAYSYFSCIGGSLFYDQLYFDPLRSPYCIFDWWKKWNPAGLILLICGNVTAVGIPILCVSRFQLLVCGWICCSRLSDGLPPCYMEDDRDGDRDPDSGLCTSFDGGEKT